MATAFSSFDTTPANVVADVKAKILLSTDWSNPSGDRVQCTTTRGAAMVVNLASAAATAQRMTLAVYRDTSLNDPVTRYINVRSNGGATSDPWHCIVSAGKEHLYISVEGPRVGEPNDATGGAGSARQFLFLSDIVPYHTSDTVAAVAQIGNPTTTNWTETNMWVSRNQANNASWVTARLASLQPPVLNEATYGLGTVQRFAAGDSKTYMFPYVVFEETDGLRGRLARAFFCGFNFVTRSTDTSVAPALTRVSYDGSTYILLSVDRTGDINTASQFGRHAVSAMYTHSAVVAIPYS